MKSLIFTILLTPLFVFAQEITVVTYSAAWCGKCRILEPKISEIKNKFGYEVKFVSLDLTDEESMVEAEREALALGIYDHFQRNAGKTGYSVLFKSGTDKIVGELNSQMEAKEMEKVIAERLPSPAKL